VSSAAAAFFVDSGEQHVAQVTVTVSRTNHDQHGRAVECSIDLFPAGRTRLHVRSQSPISARPM
jgi:GntR family transcriptional regulator